jgi:RNA polymerase I-specific transcription initiation factor RRN3
MQEPEAFSKAFVEMLLQGLREVRGTPSNRSACVAYLASFLARAAFLPEDILLDCLNQLATWCLQYAQVCRPTPLPGPIGN